MFAPITRSMTLTLGLYSMAVSSDLLAETDPEKPAEPPPLRWNWPPPTSPRKAWVPPPKILRPTPPAP